MYRRQFLSFAAASVVLLAMNGPRPMLADEAYRLSGPHVHGNLAIYFVHGKSAPGPVPLTLQEALAREVVTVHETGSVNELAIENLGEDEVYVQSADIVKGGKQDRVLMVSLLLPPHSGRLPIASFCVEQGRWSARGREDATRFASADTALPSRKAKMAMKAPGVADLTTGSASPRPHQGIDIHMHGSAGINPHPRVNETSERQQAMWRSVAEAQRNLSASVGAPVAAAQSRSSLQLSLENEKLKETQVAYIAALKAQGEGEDDIVGYVFAINGKINSADIYPSNGLFRKMWPKLLEASVTEAIGERNAPASEPPAIAAVSAFLLTADRAAGEQRVLTRTVRLETRTSEAGLSFRTERTAGGLVHRNDLAK